MMGFSKYFVFYLSELNIDIEVGTGVFLGHFHTKMDALCH